MVGFLHLWVLLELAVAVLGLSYTNYNFSSPSLEGSKHVVIQESEYLLYHVTDLQPGGAITFLTPAGLEEIMVELTYPANLTLGTRPDPVLLAGLDFAPLYSPGDRGSSAVAEVSAVEAYKNWGPRALMHLQPPDSGKDGQNFEHMWYISIHNSNRTVANVAENLLIRIGPVTDECRTGLCLFPGEGRGSRPHSLSSGRKKRPSGRQVLRRLRGGDMALSRVHVSANDKYPTETWDYINARLKWPDCGDVRIGKFLGDGKFGAVYALEDEEKERKVIKILQPNKAKKLNREVLALSRVKGGPNIMKLYGQCIYRGNFSLIFEYCENEHFMDLFPKLNASTIRYYTYQLLVALNFSHSAGLIHRDLKPHNVLVDHARQKLWLGDWGLTEFYFPGKEFNSDIASKAYKAPESILRKHDYDYAFDLWSAGCVFGGMLFNRRRLVRAGDDDEEQLLNIANVVGRREIYETMQRFGLRITEDNAEELLEAPEERPGWGKFITEKNEGRVTEEALEFLDFLLVVDPLKRPTAQEALNHAYFDGVRQSEAF